MWRRVGADGGGGSSLTCFSEQARTMTVGNSARWAQFGLGPSGVNIDVFERRSRAGGPIIALGQLMGTMPSIVKTREAT